MLDVLSPPGMLDTGNPDAGRDSSGACAGLSTGAPPSLSAPPAVMSAGPDHACAAPRSPSIGVSGAICGPDAVGGKASFEEKLGVTGAPVNNQDKLQTGYRTTCRFPWHQQRCHRCLFPVHRNIIVTIWSKATACQVFLTASLLTTRRLCTHLNFL